MKEYRQKKKEETGISQKQYASKDDIKIRMRKIYYAKTVLNDVKNVKNKNIVFKKLYFWKWLKKISIFLLIEIFSKHIV